MLTYPVNEIFQTIQGEAEYTGTPAIFIRLQGCPVACPWCDTKHTWNVEPHLEIVSHEMIAKQSDTPSFSNMTALEIIALIQEQGMTAGHIVITGGEPCLYDLRQLTAEFMATNGINSVQIETSGTHEIVCNDSTWVTVSPKLGMAMPLLKSAIQRADEIKMPIGKQADIDALVEQVLPLLNEYAQPEIWLQPLSQNEKATRLCVDQATALGFRVSIQTHKFLGVR